MTSIILMRKLLAMKLNKAEFDRIKLQQANIKQKKQKVLSSLKEILENQSSNKTCRLCLRSGGRNIFGGDQGFDVALNIRYILGVEITEDDGKPQHICSDCEHTVRQASQLKQTAETTQWRLQQELEMVANDAASDWSDGREQHGGYFKTMDADIAREWICGKCRTSFNTQEEFTEHEKLPSCRTQARGYVCETCGLEMKSMSRLKRHKLTHTNVLPHLCTACPYRARTLHALHVHARAHAGTRPARCPCGAAFASASNLASHRRTHLPPAFPCQLCGRGFKFKAALQNHMASQHSNAKPYNCNICAKAFSTRKMILRHELKAHNRPKMRSGILPSYMRIQEDN
ncbi:endothelial zinc finger protein induced by tumor necrosis factor alpha-like [Cydia strobilella]|uniref:endothelial zinc finger protein induced by tumor necrosis factor alpha-like n=1 Tax=Cydia strobilella TaxID=1100964 RepID=UPI003003F2D2